MWERVKQSEVVVRRNILPARVVLDRDAESGEYRTFLEIIFRDGDLTFMNGRIFKDLELAKEDFERRSQRMWGTGLFAGPIHPAPLLPAAMPCPGPPQVVGDKPWSPPMNCGLESG